ncbi:carbohydrate ABC transporter permease [Andreprevotia chitinilytica]|uniref:carbohydrate ABC transporter permease n=1 Tax=Andreprevotia chitinilytica TaxID=396808 RepID=UPI000A707971|nr:carbohydrate ABC transporter permease [Andreprevotia chitinilytica]
MIRNAAAFLGIAVPASGLQARGAARRASGKFAVSLLLAVAAALLLLPFWSLLVFASHDGADIFAMPPPASFGQHFGANLAALSLTPFWQAMGNSIYVAVCATVLSLLVSSLAGFALALYEFRGRRVLLGLAVLSMLLPPFLTVVPYFFWISWLGWLDQFRALYLPAAVNGLGVLLMRQYIASAIPAALLEAARLDGCNEFQLYWRIVLPLCRPALATLAVISFIGAWNNFLIPLVILPSPEHYTAPLALRALQGPAGADWGAVMAGALVAIVPTLIALLLAARHWRGVMASHAPH